MKINQNKEFIPITITLETEYEAEVLKALVANVAGGGKFRKVSSELYHALDKLGINKAYAQGTIRTGS